MAPAYVAPLAVKYLTSGGKEPAQLVPFIIHRRDGRAASQSVRLRRRDAGQGFPRGIDKRYFPVAVKHEDGVIRLAEKRLPTKFNGG
jgi:hypothetical protein